MYRLDYITSHHSTLHTTLQTLHYIASHSITLPYITQHYTASHHITLHYITSHCIAYTHTQRHIGSEGTGRHCPSRHGCAVPSNRLIFKFCQIWPQPELRRLQGFRRWKKKRHIRSVKNRTDFRNDFSRNLLSDCPFCSIWRFHVVSACCCVIGPGNFQRPL